jgi:hypothetical protein
MVGIGNNPTFLDQMTIFKSAEWSLSAGMVVRGRFGTDEREGR